jgi:cytochrome c oxidase assembly factor CtaG
MLLLLLLQAHLFIAAYKADTICNMLVLDIESRDQLVKRQIQRALSELSKVAIQVAFLPSILLLCGCLHMLMAYPNPAAETYAKATQWDKQPSELYQTLSGFIGWWSCASYVGWAFIGVVLTRAQGATD